MRILQLNNYADPVGGAEVYALALTRELRQRGHTVTFFGTSPERDVSDDCLRIVRRPRYDSQRLTRDPAVSAALADTITRVRPELIHVHNVFGLAVDVLAQLSEARVPVVQTVHDFSLLCPNSWCVLPDGTPCAGGVGAKCFQHDCTQNYPYDAEVALHSLLRQKTLSGIVDVAVCPSRYLADLTRASGMRDVRHLNYFIDPISSDACLDRADGQLLYIGRLEPEKGVDFLLNAMANLRSDVPQLHLTIVGDGSQAAPLRALAERLALRDTVAFSSHVPRSQLGRFYASATACVLPSIWCENSPLVAYECLAAGLPMLASRIAGIPELVEDGQTGFTFSPRDPLDLASKIRLLVSLTAQERKRISATMRDRALAFRSEPHIAWIEDLYRGLIRRGTSGELPSMPVDADLLAILDQYGRERSKLAHLYHEHVNYIGQLERRLASSPAAERTPLGVSPDTQSEHQGSSPPKPLLHRLSRALRALRDQ